MEITDDKLLRIALITSLIGIIGLLIFTPTIEVKKVKIAHKHAVNKIYCAFQKLCTTPKLKKVKKMC